MNNGRVPGRRISVVSDVVPCTPTTNAVETGQRGSLIVPFRPGDELDGGRLRLDARIGEGGFGEVWKATEFLGSGIARIPLREVAVKILPPMEHEDDKQRIVKEARALAECIHSTVLRFHYAFEDRHGTYLVTELASEGDLRTFFGDSLPTESELRELTFALAGGLAYLHEHGTVHGDLKPENVLVTAGDDETVRYLLADFGLRNLVGHLDFQGTVPYIPPEAYGRTESPPPNRRGLTLKTTKEALTDRADIYAFGMLLFEIATNTSSYDLLSDSELLALRQSSVPPEMMDEVHERILHFVGETHWESLNLPPFLGTLIASCLSEEAEKRPSARGLLDLWGAFERGRVGGVRPQRSGSRLDLPFGRVFYLDFSNADEPDAELTVEVAGGAENSVRVRVSRHVNPPMFLTLAGLDPQVPFHVPMVSFYGLLPQNPQEMVFEADRESYVVAEPFDLVDVTHVSTSHHCVRAYLHHVYFLPHATNVPMLKGNILHALFSDLCENWSLEFDEGWDRHWNEWCLDLAFFFPKEADFQTFRRDVEAAFRKLRNAARSEFSRASRHRELETTRWSYELGLTGRVDALFRSPSDELSVYELKTGSIRQEHLLQLQAYVALLQEELAASPDSRRPAPRVDAQILTSTDGSFRQLSSPVNPARLASIRNQILRLKQVFLEPRSPDEPLPAVYPYHGYQPEKCRRCAENERFLFQACKETTAFFGEGPAQRDAKGSGQGLSSLERDYFQHWTRMIQREQREAEQHVLAVRMENAFPGSVWESRPFSARRSERIEGATLAEVNGVRLRFTYDSSLAEFDIGSSVLIRRDEKGIAHRGVRGTVREVTETSLTVECLGNVLPRHLEAAGSDGWVVESLPDTRGMDALRVALNLFIRSTNRTMKDLVLEGRMPRKQGVLFQTREAQSVEIGTGYGLNREQTRALVRALDETGFLSVTGPPGTGKTFIIRAIIEAFIRQGGRILLAGFTNNAIDNVLERLIGNTKDATIPFVRMGPLPQRHEDMAARLESLGYNPAHFFAGTLGHALDSPSALYAHLTTAPVLVGTAYSLIRSPWILAPVMGEGKSGSDTPPFDLVLIDEATQLQEPFAAALLTLGKKAILVGDERQLGPICQSRFDADTDLLADSLREVGLGGLERSLFERLNHLLQERGESDAQVFLSQQYRMHPDIGEWASQQFYSGRLKTHPDTSGTLPELEAGKFPAQWKTLRRIFDPRYPFVCLDIEAGKGSLPNTCHEEAEIAALLANALHRLGVESVGCISPYRNQQALLQRELATFGLTYECGTVDAFQGREKDVILLSTVRRDRLTEFLTHPNRLNVSVTRAKGKCILLGSRRILAEDPLLRSIMEQEGCLSETVTAEALRTELGC